MNLRSLFKLGVINAAIFLILALVVELLFGNWIRPMTVEDLRRFNIPISFREEVDASRLYQSGDGKMVYSRDQWGLRGKFTRLEDVDVLTVGGSTTDQRYIDDAATWQSVAERAARARGVELTFANAGVDGQSSIGHRFDFDYWFPLLGGLKPKYVLFFIGVNDVMRVSYRRAFDETIDASSWKIKSAIYQFYRTIRGTMQARDAKIVHRPKPADITVQAEFVSEGMLDPAARARLAAVVSDNFIADLESLKERAGHLGSQPVFVTQNAFAWNAGRGPVSGLDLPVHIHDLKLNYADVSFLHKRMNEALMAWCVKSGTTCIDVASEVPLESTDYYDFVHTTPSGAAKIGTYIGDRLAELAAPASTRAARVMAP
jgi:hypothetical protein